MKKTGWLVSLLILSFLADDPQADSQVDRSSPKVNGSPIELSEEHSKAVKRRRRIVVQCDVFEERSVRLEPAKWLDYVFTYVDQKGSQIDSVFWDMGNGQQSVYPSKLLKFTEDRQMRRWREQGFEYVTSLIRESRKRHLEIFWHERFSEVDITPEGGLEMKTLDPVKAAHPDWVIRSWWWQGLWNAASPGLREYKLRILREIAENFDFDGIQIDFARHIPSLPPGKQWEHRDHLTEFMRGLRRMLLEVEKKRGKPFLLAVKVPETLKGCRIDGFDVEIWAKENLVDIFTLGSRSITVDVAAFREITAGRNIKLQPCLDDHHATDGYRHQPIEFLRGVFSNWWQQGADSVVTFNWSVAPAEVTARVGGTVGSTSHRQAYLEVGSPETMRYKDKRFALERRGGFPWAEGYFNRNEDRQLPAVLGNDGGPSSFYLRIGDDLVADASRVRDVTLRLVLFSAVPGDRLDTKLNGFTLPEVQHDPGWKDPQIFSPLPQPNAGSKQFDREVDPGQRLLMLMYRVPAQKFRVGENRIDIRVLDREPYRPGVDIQIEKIEVDVDYTSDAAEG